MYLKVKITFYTDRFDTLTTEEIIVKGEHPRLVLKEQYKKLLIEQHKAIVKGNNTIRGEHGK